MSPDAAPPGSSPRSPDDTISIAGIDPLSLLGPADTNLVELSRLYRTRVVVRDDTVRLSGPQGERAELKELLGRLVERCRKGETVCPELVVAEARRLRRPREGKGKPPAPGTGLVIKTPRKTIVARSPNQEDYLRQIAEKEIVFAIGPAGTGKTYLAVAAAVEALVAGRAGRIVLTRPAVEAGESLGYLPGTFKDKVDPYLRPLYDALYDMMPLERVHRFIEEEVIEVAALAFMRGRTLSESHIILDEAQNTTSTQMKMFLTRLGWNSTAVVTGDITQIDLADPGKSGLIDALNRLQGTPGIGFARFTEKDVVRPPLVSRIISAYENSRAQRLRDAESGR